MLHQKNTINFKSEQKRPKNNHLTLFAKVKTKSLIHSVEEMFNTRGIADQSKMLKEEEI